LGGGRTEDGRRDGDDGMILPGESVTGERLHVCVGYSCNNNCLFCMEEDREARFERLTAQTPEDVRRMMAAANPHGGEVMFTSGEPTLHPKLPEYVAMARDLGFATVGLITNGRRLSYRPYARSLLEAGLNHVLVSIHGPDAKTHDALTRTRGAYVQALAGLANLMILRRDFPALKVHTSYVVNKRNHTMFHAFYDAMAPFRVDQHVFNVVMPDGRAARMFDAIVPRYSEVVAEFDRFVRGLPPEGVAKVFLLDVPYCATERLPDRVRGYVERYFHFEPDGTTGFAKSPEDTPPLPSDLDLYAPAALDAEDGGRYAKVAKSLHDAMARTKRPECAACGFERYCRGVFRSYADRFGWDEFEPVRRVPEGTVQGAGRGEARR